MEAKIYDLSLARRDKAATGRVLPKEVSDIERMQRCHSWGARITRENKEILEHLIESYGNHNLFTRRQDNQFYMDLDTMVFTYVEVMDCRMGSGNIFKFQFDFDVNPETAILSLKGERVFRLFQGEFLPLGECPSSC